MASLGGGLYLAWRGTHNCRLNLMCVANGPDGKPDSHSKMMFANADASDQGPALCAYPDQLLYAWAQSGTGDIRIRVVRPHTHAPTPPDAYTRL